MSEKIKGNLLAIIDSCQKIQRFIKPIEDATAFYEDEKTFDAVLMNFIIIGEAVSRLSEEFKNKHGHIPWIKIKGFRNIVAHDYFGVDAEEVWQIIIGSIIELEKSVNRIIKEI